MARLLLTATLTLAACSQGGPGGGLAERWSRMPEPSGWQPKAGTCHASFEPQLMRSAYDPVDCASSHRFETVHVGQFPSASSADVPAAGTPEFKQAWADCDAKTTAYVGGPWRDRQLRIDLSLPARDGWAAGSRWYMCQIGVTEWTGIPSTFLTESLKGKWAGLPALEWGCGNQPDTGEFKPVDCDEPHDTEFVGSFKLDMNFAAVQSKYAANDPLFHRECLKLITHFVGARGTDQLPRATGSSYWLPDGKDWDAGDQSVRCFLWFDGRQVSRSLRNAGTGALVRG